MDLERLSLFIIPCVERDPHPSLGALLPEHFVWLKKDSIKDIKERRLVEKKGDV